MNGEMSAAMPERFIRLADLQDELNRPRREREQRMPEYLRHARECLGENYDEQKLRLILGEYGYDPLYRFLQEEHEAAEESVEEGEERKSTDQVAAEWYADCEYQLLHTLLGNSRYDVVRVQPIVDALGYRALESLKQDLEAYYQQKGSNGKTKDRVVEGWYLRCEKEIGQ